MMQQICKQTVKYLLAKKWEEGEKKPQNYVYVIHGSPPFLLFSLTSSSSCTYDLGDHLGEDVRSFVCLLPLPPFSVFFLLLSSGSEAANVGAAFF